MYGVHYFYVDLMHSKGRMSSMGLFSRWKNKQQVEQIIVDPITNVKELMENLGVPDWLQHDLIAVLKSKRKSMSNEEISDWLKQMASLDTLTIPEEFQVEKSLQECFSTHINWVESQIEFYEEVTYENVDVHLKKLPAHIQKMNRQAQKAYLAVSTSLLNIFSQID